jgi:hypothetical protein
MGLFALINPDVSCGGSLVDYFLFLHHVGFGDDYRVNRDCAHSQIQHQLGKKFW